MSVCAIRGATLYWDPDSNAANDNLFSGAGLGGVGNWNTTGASWQPGDSTPDTLWTNGTLDTAFFWGTAGTVTLTSNITVGGLTFATTSYTIAGTNSLTFGAATNYVQLQNIAGATISAPIAGTGDIVVTSEAFGGQAVSTLTLSGGGSGFTGGVVVNNGMTVALSGASGTALSNTSGLTLNGGGLSMTNTTGAMGSLDRVNNVAPILSNGGTINYTNSAGAANSYAETLGVVTLNSGRLTIISANATTSPATEVLTLSGLVRNASSTATLAIGGTGVGANAQNQILVTGMSATPAGQIVGPWATFGTTASAQTDYLVYDVINGFKGAAIGASGEDTWTTAANAYTLSAPTALTGTRTITGLRYTGGSGDLTLAAGSNLQTSGVLNGGSGTLSIQPGTGGILTTPAGGGALYLITGNSQPITVNAPITDNGGAVTVVHSGGSTLTLGSTANSFSGGVVINSGTVAIAADTNLGGANGGITFNGSAALNLTAASTLAATRTITLNNTALATINTTNLAQTIAGNVTGTGGLIVNGGGTLNLNGTNNDFQGVLRIGNGTNSTTVGLNSLTDSAAANGAIRLGSGTTSGTFVWNTTAVDDLVLNNRQIDLAGTTGAGVISNNSSFALTINTDLIVSTAGTKTLQLQGTGNGTFNGRIDGGGSVINLTKTNTGTWTLGGQNSFTGNIQISQGTLIFSSAANLGSLTTIANINIGNASTVGSTLQYSGAGDTVADKIVLNTTTATDTISASGTGAVIFSDTAAITVGVGAKTFTLTGTNTDANEIKGIIQNSSGGATNLSKTGAGTWVLSGANTYTNTTIGSSTVAGGLLRLSGGGTLGTGSLTVTAGALEISGTADSTVTTITLGGGAAGSQSSITIGAGRTLNQTGNFTFSATNNNLTSTISGPGTLNLGAAARTFTIGDSTAAASDVTIIAVLNADAAGGLIKAGTGTLRMAGTSANTISGLVTVNSGVLELGKTAGVNALGIGNLIITPTATATVRLLADEQIANTATVSLSSSGSTTVGRFDLNGFTETVGGIVITGTTSAGVSVTTGATGVLKLNGDIVFNNNRTNDGSNSARHVLITGTGTASTAAANTGILDLGGQTRTMTVSTTILNPGNNDAMIETVIQNGGIIKEGTQTLVLNSDNTYTGGTTINNGTLRIGSGGTTGSILGSVTDNAALEISRSDVYSFDNLVIGTGTVAKSGTGTETLTANNTYTGGTLVNAGTLSVSSIGGTGVLASNLGAGNSALSIGSATTTAGIFTYTGAGETTDRNMILAATTTGAATINSSGTGALNWQGNVNSLGTTKTFTLSGTYTGSDNTFSGVINIGTGSLGKTGAATWVLTAANAYANTTIGTAALDGGILRLAGAGTLGSGSLSVIAGTLQLAGVDQTITTLTMGGGVVGSSSTIDLGAGHKLTLGGNVTFSATNNNQTSTVTGAAGSKLDFGGAVRTFNVGNSTAVDTDMLVDANVTAQNGGLIKAGAGTLVFAGTNTLSSFEVQAGALVTDLGTANLVLNGGVYESSGTFARDLGTGPNQVQWVAGANGGFSAHGAPLTVTLNSGATLIWDGTTNFVSGLGQLLFGSVTSDNAVEFTNNVDLNNTGAAVTRTVQLLDNAASDNDKAILSGVLSGSGAGAVTLAKTGAGVLELRGNNTFIGTVSIAAGVLQFSNASNLGNAGNNALSMTGGTLQYLGTGGTALNGAFTVATATATLNHTGTGIWQLTGPVSLAAGLTINGTSPVAFTNTLLNIATAGTITINNTAGVTFGNINLTDGTTARTLDFVMADGATATINGVIANGGTGSSAFRKDGPGTLILNGANTFTNELRLNQGTLQINTTSTVLQTSTNSIVLNNTNVLGATSTLILNGADYNLNGSIVYVGNSSNAQSTATITGTGKLNLNASRTIEVRPSTDPTGKVVIATEIANGTAASGLTKTRYGTLVLSGANTYTGTTTVSEGAVVLDYTANTGSKISATGALSFGGGVLELDGNATASVTQGLTGLTVGTGGNVLIVDSRAGGAVTLNIAGALTATATGRALDFKLLGTSSTINTTGATGWTVTNGMLGGWATYNSSRFATVDGSGNIVAAATTAKDDVSTWGLNENVVDSTSYFGTMANAPKISSLALNAAATSTVNVSRFLNLDSGGVLVAPSVGANAGSINGGNLITTAAAFYINQFNTTQAVTISSAIRGNPSLSKSGEGELILNSSTNDYTGVTQINRGTLTVMGGNAIGDTSAVTLDGAPGVTLRLLDDESIGSLAGGGADGGLVDMGNHTLTLNNGASYNGLIVGSGTIIKKGTTNFALNTVANTGFTGSVIIDQGLVQLAGSGIANMGAATSWLIEPSGALLVDNNGASTSANRMLDTAPVIFNSVNGLTGTQPEFRGLWVRTDQNSTRGETVGAVTYNSGSSYAVFEASTTITNTASISEVVAASFTRNNKATLSVRGTNLGTSAAIQRGRFRLATAAETAFTTGAGTGNLIGGAGLANSSTISIVPWVVGQDLGTNLQSTTLNNERGNSLVTYVTGVGFRPLNFSTEYTPYTGAGTTNNVRETLTSDLTGLTGQTINALVVNNASNANPVAVTGSGALVVTSGAFLFTAVDGVSATGAELAIPQGIVLNGFGSITVGPVVGSVGNEFIFHVEDSAGMTISSNLVDSTAGGTAMTKSGIGSLFLTGNNTYSGNTTINEGVLEINSWSAIGGASGVAKLVLAGGTLRLDPGIAGDFNHAVQLADAGGILDVEATAVVLNAPISDLPGMSGNLTKTGPGTLTINTPASYTGTTSILGGVWNMGIDQGIGLGDLVVNNATLNLQSFDATVGKVTLVSAAGSLITGTGTLTSNNSIFDVQQGVIDAVLAGSSGLIKSTTATGSVTLNGLNTYTGATEVRIGTLSFNSISNVGGGPSALGAPTTVVNGTIRAGSTTNTVTLLYTGSGNSSNRRIDLVGTTGGLIITQNGAGALALNGGILNGGAGAKTLTLQGSDAHDNIIGGGIEEGGNGSITLSKLGTGKWILAGANSYTGPTTVNGLGGILQVNAGSNISAAATTVTAGTLDLRNGVQTITTLTMGNGVADSTSAVLLNGGALNLGGNVTVTASSTAGASSIENGTLNLFGDRTFTINESTAASVDMLISAVIADGDLTARALIKTGAGTLVFNSSNTYTGTTSINQGVLRSLADQTMTGALQFGSTNAITTAGTFDLSAASATFSSMVVQTNSTTATNNLILGVGETLTVNGNVNIGSSQAVATTTLFTASGGGQWVVNNTAASGVFQAGGAIVSTAGGNRTIADLSGLSQLAVTLNSTTGTFRVNSTSGANTSSKYATLILPGTGLGKTTVTANLLAVGDGIQFNGGATAAVDINTLLLGSGENIFRVNTINIGTGTRDMGAIAFNTASGSVDIRNTAGSGRTAFNMGTTGGGTGAGGGGNVFDVSGHLANLLLGVVNIGTQNRFNAYTNTFSFDQGTLDMTSLTMSVRTTGSTTTGVAVPRTVTSTMNLGGGTVTIQSGILNLANVAGTYNTTDNPAPVVTGIVNVSGGNVTIGATGGTAITMATNSASSDNGIAQAVATLNLTGGAVTVNGNIVRGTFTGNGSAAATLNLDGAILDMTGKNVGTATNPVALNALSGTLKNLHDLNGGGSLTKTSGGTLVLDGINAYLGQTVVNAGTVLVSGSISGSTIVNDSATLGGNGGTTAAIRINSGGTLAPGPGAGALSTGNIDLAAGGILSLELGTTVAGTGYDQLNVTGTVSLAGQLHLSLITGFAAQVGDTYYVILNNGSDAVANVFTNVTPQTATTGTFTLENGWQFTVNYAANAPLGDGGGNDVAVTLLSIPEPNALSMLAASVGLSLGLQRLRRRSGSSRE